MNKIKVFCIFLILAVSVSAFSQVKVQFTPPVFEGTGIFAPGGMGAGIVTELNDKLKVVFADDGDILGPINDALKPFGGVPENFVRAFGTSSVYASHGATQRGYAGYRLFAATFGPTLGIRVPGKPAEIISNFDGILEGMLEDGDLEMGLIPQLMVAQVGLHPPKFLPLPNKLSLGAQIGFMNRETFFDVEGLHFNTLSLGLRANYQLIASRKLPLGILVWRGINLGSGLIYQKTDIGFAMSMGLDDLTGGTFVSGTEVPVKFDDPKASIDLVVKTVTIPLEATTAIKVLFLNITGGLGVDLGFGSSTLGAGLAVDNIHIDTGDLIKNNLIIMPGSAGTISEKTPGEASLGLEGSVSPSFFNFKFITGIGFSLGPVIIDIPLTYSPGGDGVGVSIGLTAGVVW